LVSAALEGIAGVNRYEVNSMRREARVFYDPSQLDQDSLMDQLKKKTRYRSMSIKG